MTSLDEVAGRRWTQAALGLVLVSALVAAARLSAMELAPDEAYYWDWSRRLALGYYDQGPLIAYLIRLTTGVFGVNEFGVRIGVTACTAGTLWCCFLLGRRVFDARAGFIATALLAVTPLIRVGSTIATYDPPMAFFWTLGLVCLERALFLPRERANRWWAAAGLITGLGFLSKHTMLLLAPCLLLYLLISKRQRFWAARPQPYLAFLLSLLCYSGVFWWNAHHHWWTFRHLLFLTAATGHTNAIRRLGDTVGAQAALLGPLLFLGMLTAALWRRQHHNCMSDEAADPNAHSGAEGLKPHNSMSGEDADPNAHLGAEGLVPHNSMSDEDADPNAHSGAEGLVPHNSMSDEDADLNAHSGAEGLIPHNSMSDEAADRRRFLICTGLPVFLFFVTMALKSKVQGNWAICAWPSLAVLIAGDLSARITQGSRRAVWWIGAMLATSGFVTLLLFARPLRERVGIRIPPETDLTNQTEGWRQVAGRVEEVRGEMRRDTGREPFLCGNGYQYCALMAFYLPDHPRAQDMFLHYRLTMYAASVEDLRANLGRDAVFINDGMADDADLRRVFTSVVWDPPLDIRRPPLYRDRVHRIYIARCRGYRLYTGLRWAVGG